MDKFVAGAAAIDISPKTSQFLYGYPHVERYCTSIHDPLFSSALYLDDRQQAVLFVANDVIFVGRDLVLRARRRIAAATGLEEAAILISATHTHSGPVTVNYVSNAGDAAVPKADPDYLCQLEDGIVDAAIAAIETARPAEAGFACASSEGLGGNRRDPAGPADRELPVLLVRDAQTQQPFACLVVCAMHPTVLHQDSTSVSGDFPGLARRHLQEQLLGPDGVFLFHMGAAGNQSPRHVTKSNTFAEASRLGGILCSSVQSVVADMRFREDVSLSVDRVFVNLPRATFPSVADAEQKRAMALGRLEALRQNGAPAQHLRTAECDWFGAEETVTLARAAADGRLAAVCECLLPAEIQLLQVGPWRFVGWPGEIFVEYALALRAQAPATYPITLANGELQGYIVTPEAAAEGGYEASNAVFAAESGAVILERTRELLDRHQTIANTKP